MSSPSSAARPRPRWSPAYTVVLLCFAAVFISYIDRTNISVAAIAMQEEFKWSETTKGFVLSSFFVGYILLQVVSAGLANKYGGKLLLGVAVIWWSAFTMLTPVAASLGLATLIASRIALGLGEAAVFPACINMVGRWVPAAQRSRAVALFSSGLSIGTVFSLPVTGWLVREYGWPVPFYAFGLVGLVWAVAWFTKVSAGRGIPEEATNASRTIPWGASCARRLCGRSSSITSATTGRYTSCWRGSRRTSRQRSTSHSRAPASSRRPHRWRRSSWPTLPGARPTASCDRGAARPTCAS
ncbi:MAG: MFS transporter [Gemmatimonadetes bacterium]|nr:MFS transporter [Gemmatimonadota bacterium]